MIRCVALCADNLPDLEAIYPEFQEKAQPDYRWEYPPLDFAHLPALILGGELSGYLLVETASPLPLGFVLFRQERYRTIEINMFFLRDPALLKIVLDRFMRKFIQDIRKLPDWDVVSWALLGRQMDFIRTITWYGFKPVGQAIVKFEFTNPLSLEILRLQETRIPPLPDPFRITPWQESYQERAAEVIYQAFHSAADSLWDPRFRSREGAAEVIGLITSGAIGDFIPEGVSVLLKDDLPMGFCFLLQSMVTRANIPLIGLHPDEIGKGFSKYLLMATMQQCRELLMNGTRALLELNATLDTDNSAAIRMYRRFGFRDDYNYGHVYLPREKAESMVIGQWCQTPRGG